MLQFIHPSSYHTPRPRTPIIGGSAPLSYAVPNKTFQVAEPTIEQASTANTCPDRTEPFYNAPALLAPKQMINTPNLYH
jgi:hypothetical protein